MLCGPMPKTTLKTNHLIILNECIFVNYTSGYLMQRLHHVGGRFIWLQIMDI